MKSSILRSLLGVIIGAGVSGMSYGEDAPIIATVNGSAITEQVFMLYGEKRIGVPPGGPGFPPEKIEELKDELINRELIYQDALKLGLDKDHIVQLQIQEQTHNLITRERINKLLQDTPPSKEMMMEIYKTQIVDPASKEYHARHILLDDQEAAKEIILELNKGADFAALAKEKSTGPSAIEGGDLGWFSPNQMAQAFSDAVEKLKPGEYTTRPVKTRFGWHIIKLEEARVVEPPPFESVQEQLLKVAQNKIINDYLAALKDKASIEIK